VIKTKIIEGNESGDASPHSKGIPRQSIRSYDRL
jgi:hypothetical protein